MKSGQRLRLRVVAVAAMACSCGSNSGVAVNGAFFFNDRAATGLDAVLTESWDNCQGHADERGGGIRELRACEIGRGQPSSRHRRHRRYQ